MVFFPPYEAKVLVWGDGDDHSFYLKAFLKSIFPPTEARNALFGDSCCIFDTFTRFHDRRGYWLRTTVLRIIKSYESSERDSMRWIPGTLNLADVLTKRNLRTPKLPKKLLVEGSVCNDIKSGYIQDKATWMKVSIWQFYCEIHTNFYTFVKQFSFSFIALRMADETF